MSERTGSVSLKLDMKSALQPISVQVNDGTAIELKSSLAKKALGNVLRSARTKSNVNGS